LSREIKNTDWGVLLQLADAYHVSPALCVSLKRKGVIESLDTEVHDCLEGIYELNCYHNKTLKKEALNVIRLINTKQVQPVLLKGMAGLMTGLYSDDGERIIGDIDLLVEQSELSEVLRVLLDHGYYCEKEIYDKVFSATFYTHELTLMTESWSAKIDLHVRPTGPSGNNAFVSTQGAKEQADEVEIEGSHFLLPSPLFRLMHNFYHAQYLDRAYLDGSVNLRQLLDWVKLWQRYGEQVDYSAMEEKLIYHGQVRSSRLYMLNAERYLGLPVPSSVKIGVFEKLLFCRQNLIMQYYWFRIINSILVSVLNSVQLIIPERLRLTHGDLPLPRLIALRFADFFDPHWYGRRLQDLRKMFGFNK
jgi:hypothetical protein